MTPRKRFGLGLIMIGLLTGCFSDRGVDDQGTGAITGAVISDNGPEAGVWVIAETNELPTRRFRKIVVTDDGGRFLLPDLPNVEYEVWVRGYGLIDSEPIEVSVGDDVTLSAVAARTPQEAARVYPANYWASMIDLPGPEEFPGTGESENGISQSYLVQEQWANGLMQCMRCHQLGSIPTRTVPDLQEFESTFEAWDHRVLRGQRVGTMNAAMTAFGRERAVSMFADWSDRIAAGEVPATTPPRPTGLERNIVLTMWNWADSVAFMHDVISTDKRDPTVNPDGPIYGVDIGNDHLTIVDPGTHQATMLRVPVRPGDQVPPMFDPNLVAPYRYFGETTVWHNPANPHNPMMDAQGRVWLTTQIRARDNAPEWCLAGSSNPYAQYFPAGAAMRNTGYYDPQSDKFVLIDTCFGTHHLQFGEDSDNTLWFSGDTNVVGWLNVNMWDTLGDERAAQGWCPKVIDTNGDGRITRPWNEPGATMDPARDTRVGGFPYGIISDPTDESVWWADGDQFVATILRMHRGDNPPETCITERYNVPLEHGFRSRGIDIDRNGLVWLAVHGGGLASFDRSKCAILSGPAIADGNHCPEGWTSYPTPEVTFEGTDLKADFHYYNWVDQFNTLGLGENIPIANGSNSDSLLALDPETGEWVIIRIPYPQGFYSRGMDGRIDDPDAGWKGRGLYVTYGADAAWHVEGGPREPGNLVKIQLRPDPLAN